MPSKTKAQARLMAAVAHGWKKPGGGGPSVKVAKEFNQADKSKHERQRRSARRHKHLSRWAAGKMDRPNVGEYST